MMAFYISCFLNCFTYYCLLITMPVFDLQTVAVIPVNPHGVVQLGSSLSVSPFSYLLSPLDMR